MREKKQTGRFIVETEEGERINVFEYTDIILTPSFEDGPEKEQEGRKEYRTATNHHVNRLDEETYEIVETGQRVKRIA